MVLQKGRSSILTHKKSIALEFLTGWITLLIYKKRPYLRKIKFTYLIPHQHYCMLIRPRASLFFCFRESELRKRKSSFLKDPFLSSFNTWSIFFMKFKLLIEGVLSLQEKLKMLTFN